MWILSFLALRSHCLSLLAFTVLCGAISQPEHILVLSPTLQCRAGGECGVPFWQRFFMPTGPIKWVDSQSQRRSPEWYSFDHGPIHFLQMSTEVCAILAFLSCWSSGIPFLCFSDPAMTHMSYNGLILTFLLFNFVAWS